MAAGRELSELAKTHPQRVVELVKLLLVNGPEDPVRQPICDLADSNLTDDEVFTLVRDVASTTEHSEELRANLSYLLYRRSRERVGLPDDLCRVLVTWLEAPWTSDETTDDSLESQEEPKTVDSILWGSGGGLAHVDRSFWSLLAATHAYLLRSPPEMGRWLDTIERHIGRDISEHTWVTFCLELRWIQLRECDLARGAATVIEVFRRFPNLVARREGVRLIAQVSYLLPGSFLESCLDALCNHQQFKSRQAFGELLTLIAFRDVNHAWASDRLSRELATIGTEPDEAIQTGMAFTAAQLWDEPDARLRSSQLLARLVPAATERVGRAIATDFWARDEFPDDEATETLLQAFSKHPLSLSKLAISDLVEHLAALLPHKRRLILDVCNAILQVSEKETDLFEAGPSLVRIAMTLQRFPDTRPDGLAPRSVA